MRVDQKGGVIINMGSIASVRVPPQHQVRSARASLSHTCNINALFLTMPILAMPGIMPRNACTTIPANNVKEMPKEMPFLYLVHAYEFCECESRS